MSEVIRDLRPDATSARWSYDVGKAMRARHPEVTAPTDVAKMNPFSGGAPPLPVADGLVRRPVRAGVEVRLHPDIAAALAAAIAAWEAAQSKPAQKLAA